MKISYKLSGGEYVTLADEASREWLTGWLPRMVGQAQLEPLFRAASVEVYDRQNRYWSFSGTVDREHADLSACASFVQSQAATLVGKMTLKMEHGSTTIYLKDAVLVGYVPSVTGKSSMITYEFVGSELATSE